MSAENKLNLSSGAIVCEHIARSDNPTISYAQRDCPEEPEDSGWQFCCGVEVENWEEARVWSLSEVLQIAPDLGEFINSQPGTILTRSGPADEWQPEMDSASD